MPSVEFVHSGKSFICQAGEKNAITLKSGFMDTSSSDMLDLIAAINRGDNWRDLVAARYETLKPWLYQIITSATRTAFFRDVLPQSDGPVLDIGSGWGQIARPLARERFVVALEPVAERLAFIEAASRQDRVASNLAFIQSDYLETDFKTRFDAICAIGVLEWAGAFQSHSDPQQRQKDFLQKTRRELASGGALILGIENRLGLKYLRGCPDDHIGVPNIACLPAPLARQRWQEASGHTLRSFTYSLAELTALLHAAGFTTISVWGAFPDYKLPSQIISLADHGKELNTWLLNTELPHEHNGYDGTPLASTEQVDLVAHYRSLAAEGIAHHFVPSFFIRAV